MKKLNWSGFCITMLLVMVSALANESVTDFKSWLVLVVLGFLIGGLFVLIVGGK